MEESNSLSIENAKDSKVSLRWYQFRLSSILWLTLVVALLVTNIMMRNRLSVLEPQLKKIKEEGALRETEPGWITEVGFGPGWIFRGDLPKGKWRLAVYYWNGKMKDILDEAPPPDLPPLFAAQIPSYKKVDIQVSEAELPSDTIYEGKAVVNAYNFKILDDFPGPFGCVRTYSMGPVLLSSRFGCTTTRPKNLPVPNKRGIMLWSKGAGEDVHLLLQLEPIDEKSLPPQRDKEFYNERSRQLEELAGKK